MLFDKQVMSGKRDDRFPQDLTFGRDLQSYQMDLTTIATLTNCRHW
jgi:hypothetical protein